MLHMLLSPFVLLPLVTGALLFWCFRTKDKTWRIVLAMGVLACVLVGWAATNPVPGSEGPGLLALIFVVLAIGAFVALVVSRFLPKPIPLLNSPAWQCSGWLLGTMGTAAVASFAIGAFMIYDYQGAPFFIFVMIPLLYGMSGWLMPKRARPDRPLTWVLLLLAWSLLPAGLIYWSEASHSTYATYVSFLTLPHRTMGPILFAPLFYKHASAFELEVLRPLATASTHLLLMVCFVIGMLVKRREERTQTNGQETAEE